VIWSQIGVVLNPRFWWVRCMIDDGDAVVSCTVFISGVAPTGQISCNQSWCGLLDVVVVEKHRRTLMRWSMGMP